jgi:hypothetical protein
MSASTRRTSAAVPRVPGAAPAAPAADAASPAPPSGAAVAAKAARAKTDRVDPTKLKSAVFTDAGWVCPAKPEQIVATDDADADGDAPADDTVEA